MEFEIVEGPCFGGPDPAEFVLALLIVSVMGGMAAIPVGWASRRLFLLRNGGVDE